MKLAKEIFKIESLAISNLSNLLTSDFNDAVQNISKCSGKLIVSGMGKSGIIGRKIAATFASTGTPSFFLHPGEAYHGDLGMIQENDIILLLSNSGETDEVLKLIPYLKTQNNIIISITGRTSSTLAKNSNYHLNVSVDKEGCPLNLAPMSSTTATLVMGDALAVSLMKVKEFKDKDFARFHPGGSLGRRLLTKVENVMISTNLPTCALDTNIKDIIKIMSSGKFGLTVVLNESKIEGIITDGDIRRAMEDENNFFTFNAISLMTKKPKTINHNAKLTEAQVIMTNMKINSLLVIKNELFIGIVQIYDLGL